MGRQTLGPDGYVHLPGFFTHEEVGALRAAIEEAGRPRAGTSSIDDGAMTFLSLLFPSSPELQAFISDQRLLDVVCPALDDDVWVRWDQAVIKGDGAPTFPWHQDNGYSLLHDEHLQVWVALTAAGPDDGGLWVVPGSHRTARPHRSEGPHVVVEEAPGDGVPIVADPGDLVVFSSRLLHRTTPNVSGRDRWTYVVEYLPVNAFDPFLAPPYFVASSGGSSRPRFTRWLPGRRSVRQQVAYLPERLRVRRREGTWRRGI